MIRPLVYVRETEAEAFAETSLLPIVPENCPACFEAPKERYRVKCLLATQVGQWTPCGPWRSLCWGGWWVLVPRRDARTLPNPAYFPT